MFFYVQLWQRLNTKVSPLRERVQAPSEGHAVIAVMRAHHLTYVDRAWVSRDVTLPPTVRLTEVTVKGKVRAWKQEPEAGSSWEQLQQVALELGYSVQRDLYGVTLEHEQRDTITVCWRELDCLALLNLLYRLQKQPAKKSCVRKQKGE